MSKWDYIIERLSSIRPAKTYRLRDMKTDDEVWWEESIPVPEDYNVRMMSELCDEVSELRETNAHLENEITDLKIKLKAKEAKEQHWLASSSTNDIAFAIERKAREQGFQEGLKEKEKKMENEDWKRVNYYAEGQASNHPDDIAYIEILIKGGSDEQTEKIILESLPDFYADIWGRNPEGIYRIINKGLPKTDIENMQQVWPEKVVDDVIIDYGDTSIKQLCKQIDKLIQENKNLSERISLLNAELDMLEDELVACSAYSEQLEKLVPKKKLKKLWKKQKNS